jgi:hypothetical protein
MKLRNLILQYYGTSEGETHTFIAYDNIVTDCTMTQAVTCRPVLAETEIQTQTNTCGVCIRQSGTDTYAANNINNFDGNKDNPITDGWPDQLCLM